MAAALLISLGSGLAVAAPFAHIKLAETERLLPAYAAAMFVTEILTGALLLALFSIRPSRDVLILATGYLFSGLLVLPWALTFPGVFVFPGFQPGLQSTATIAGIRRLAFPLFVIAYTLTKDRATAAGASWSRPRPLMILTVFGTLAVALALSGVVLANPHSLPHFMNSERAVGALWQYVSALSLLLYAVGLSLLWIRRRSLLDLWLLVVLSTLGIEILLLSYISAGTRLTVGWWAGRAYGLASASIVLVALLSQTTALQDRLVRSLLAERRTREARLGAMEALSASIAHEVNQPLASMVTNADAGLRWLGKSSPDLGETEAALRRIVSDGHRAGKVIESLRSMFKKAARERMPTDLNVLIENVVAQARAEARSKRVFVETALEEDLPHVFGSPVQLRQVLANLVANAVDAIDQVSAGPRIVHVVSRWLPSNDVLVTVSDTGSGLDETDQDRIFEPFFTTKPGGMGMGLMICRSIIEADAGRLWVARNEPRGAVFSFTLPALPDRSRSMPEPVS